MISFNTDGHHRSKYAPGTTSSAKGLVSLFCNLVAATQNSHQSLSCEVRLMRRVPCPAVQL
jgi:hypothetical protein